ncbi:Orotate phosphoribosyltransferase [bacterium HR36]|nr:Orotate phosphoribosyltransferase [bacterium HR36]
MIELSAMRQRLLELIRQRAVRFGEVVLASGQKSSFYIDCKMVLLNSEAAAIVGELVYEMTKDLPLDALGGPEVGAIPIVMATVIAYHRHGRRMEGFFVRKTVKEHGTQKKIEGKFEPGYRVALVEDVTTTGMSSLQVMDTVEQAGGKIVCVVAVFDREQGAAERFAQRAVTFLPIFRLSDLGLSL